ncbi:MAG: DUF523 domain-containing protein [Bacillota bacterium]
MLLVSSCLLGCDCKYNGGNNEMEEVTKLADEYLVVPICPESVELPTPRPPAEIKGGSGADVLVGKAKVITNEGQDVSNEFIDGAYQALQQAKVSGINLALLKARSPSCGKNQIYAGDFSGELRAGDGVTTALLRQNGPRRAGSGLGLSKRSMINWRNWGSSVSANRRVTRG